MLEKFDSSSPLKTELLMKINEKIQNLESKWITS